MGPDRNLSGETAEAEVYQRYNPEAHQRDNYPERKYMTEVKQRFDRDAYQRDYDRAAREALRLERQTLDTENNRRQYVQALDEERSDRMMNKYEMFKSNHMSPVSKGRST